jgi:hypothetical protein
MMKKTIILICLTLLLAGCNNKVAGTLGSGYKYVFNCSEEQLNTCMNKFQQTSKKLVVPEKWIKYNNWEEVGYGFLNGNVFYLKSDNLSQEEMYYVTVLGSNSKLKNKATISIRSVFRIIGQSPRWLYFEDLSQSDKIEIENRFQRTILSGILKKGCSCNSYKINKEELD